MDNRPVEKITLYSYIKVWRIEKKIYAIQNFILPVPIDPWQLLYFGGTWVVCNLIFRFIPGFSNIPVIIRSIAVPFLISNFLMTKKLDGKTPIRYMLGAVEFLITEQGKSIERFHRVPENQGVIKLEWNCSKGIPYTKEERHVPMSH